MKIIMDGKNRIVGQVVECGPVVFVKDGQGRPKGQYLKLSDVTLDEKGRFAGRGDQTMRLLK